MQQSITNDKNKNLLNFEYFLKNFMDRNDLYSGKIDFNIMTIKVLIYKKQKLIQNRLYGYYIQKAAKNMLL